MLVKLWTSWTVLLQSSSDSLDDVQEFYYRIEVLPKKATLYFCCKGRNVLLRTERALCVSINCDGPPRSRHLELEICIVWHRIKFCECGSSEQGVIATTEWDYVED